MFAETRRPQWMALLLGAVVLAAGCSTASSPLDRGTFRQDGSRPVPALAHEGGNEPPRVDTAPHAEGRLHRRRRERVEGTVVAMVSPADMAMRTVASGAVRVDAFEELLLRAGLGHHLPAPGAPLTPPEATRVLTLLLNEPVTMGSLPPRMAVCHLLREVLESGEASREELLRRVERFHEVAVLRPDGYLAWVSSGRTQQKALGTLEWKDGAFRAGPLELGRFYVARSGVFRHTDARLQPVMDGPPLAEVYDDADYISRTLDGAEDAFVALYHAMGQLLSYPTDSFLALQHLPTGVAALLASSPEYLERFHYMTRGEQVREISRLATSLLVTWGAASGTTRTLTSALRGVEATVPVLSLSAQGALMVERLVLPAGSVGTVLSGGSGAAIILHRVRSGGQSPSPAPGPGQWGPADEVMSESARRYQEQITGRSADDAYWVGGVGKKSKGVKFDGYKDGVLLDAKGPNYDNKFLANLDPKAWFKHSGAQALVDQAKRQTRAANGVPIRWHVAEEKTANAIRKLFELKDVTGIEVVFTPPYS
jgi:hypothetical protein